MTQGRGSLWPWAVGFGLVLGALLVCFNLSRPPDIVPHESGQAVFIARRSCTVNDVDSAEDFQAMLAWCAEQWHERRAR